MKTTTTLRRKNEESPPSQTKRIAKKQLEIIDTLHQLIYGRLIEAEQMWRFDSLTRKEAKKKIQRMWEKLHAKNNR